MAPNRIEVGTRVAFSLGKRYQELVPNAVLVSPNKTPDLRSYTDWRPQLVLQTAPHP